MADPCFRLRKPEKAKVQKKPFSDLRERERERILSTTIVCVRLLGTTAPSAAHMANGTGTAWRKWHSCPLWETGTEQTHYMDRERNLRFNYRDWKTRNKPCQLALFADYSRKYFLKSQLEKPFVVYLLFEGGKRAARQGGNSRWLDREEATGALPQVPQVQLRGRGTAETAEVQLRPMSAAPSQTQTSQSLTLGIQPGPHSVFQWSHFWK